MIISIISQDENLVSETSDFLNTLGYTVAWTASSLKEATAFQKKNKAGFLILDIRLFEKTPQENEGDLPAEFKHVPFIFLTQILNNQIIDKIKNYDSFGYLLCPFNERELLATIELTINKYNYESRLEKLTEELESKVLERTKEILDLNKELKNEIETIKAFQQRLLNKRAKLNTIFKQSNIGIIITSDEGIITEFNDASTVALNTEKLQNVQIWNVLPRVIWETAHKELEETISGHSIHRIKLDKKSKWFEIVAQKFYQNTSPFYTFTLVDITKEKKQGRMLEKQKIKNTLEIINAQENERKRISMEIHDNLGQKLTSAKLHLGAALKHKNITQKDESIKHLKQLLEEAITDSRTISENLTPSTITRYGLDGALKLLADSNQTEINFVLNMQHIRNIDEKTSMMLYRIAQEAINNSIKHAYCTTIKITLKKEKQKILMQIEDNGRGIDQRKIRSLLNGGLKNMEYRSKLIEGDFHITSSKGKGTKVTLLASLR